MSVTKVSSPMIESGTKGADIASAATVVIGTDGSYFDITGTTGISTQFTVDAGRRFTLQFDGIVTITDNAAITLAGAANFTTAAGDILSFVAVAANTVVQTGYSLVDGGSPVAPAGGGLTSKVVSGNYDMSVTGSLAVTGAGFVPTACIVFIHKDSDAAASWGFTSSTVTDDGNIHDLHNGGVADRNSSSGLLWTLQTGSGVNANGVVASYDADGATFTRTKLGSPTGTAYYKILFMK